MRGREAPVAERAAGVVARPALIERLSAGDPDGVTLISAAAGTGKTVLLRSWLGETKAWGRTAWVAVEHNEDDAQAFWLTVVEQLRQATGGAGPIGELAPAVTFDGEAVVHRVVSELASLAHPVILVIDDLHELISAEANAQLEMLLAQKPRSLRVILATRHDPQLGLHRLRLTGQLIELRGADLRFSHAEAHDLLAASGVTLSAGAVDTVVSRTEGWAAGLRLVALSLSRHADPDAFITAFSGSERTVADYLLAEVLERQTEPVRRLLLRTSILPRVNGSLADRLTEGLGSERILLELEDANAFVVSIDAGRSWFRYHRLFADLLRLELRRTEPALIPGLHLAAARWFAEHGDHLDAIRHAQAAEDWTYAGRLLAEHGFSLSLDGRAGAIGSLVAAFPADSLTDPELAAYVAYWEATQHSLDGAAAYIALAERHVSHVLPQRQHRVEALLATARLALARRRGDLDAALREAGPLLEIDAADTAGDVAMGNDARALALMNLGIVELWAFQWDDSARHLGEALKLARRVGRPYVVVRCLSHLALLAARESIARARSLCEEAVAIADAHGWGGDPVACPALATLASLEAGQGLFAEGRRWLERAESCMRPEIEPATALLVHWVSGELHIGAGKWRDAIEEFRVAEQFQLVLATEHALTGMAKASIAHAQLQLGEASGAQTTLAGVDDRDLDLAEARAAMAHLRLTQGRPEAAIELLTPVLDGSAPAIRTGSVIEALLLDAVAHAELGEVARQEADIELALDTAEGDGLIFPFLMVPAQELLERHPRHRTAHAAMLSDILDALSGEPLAPRRRPDEAVEALTESELRVLRHLPTNLSAPEIAATLYLSTSTVKTHMRHVYEKLGVHRRSDAVERARQLGLIGSRGRLR
jgi:LuxR family transcriptional regulator, maltose regulon positive regulatory protein